MGMTMMDHIKAGEFGEMSKYLLEDLREDEHEAMMKATVEEMLDVMRTDMKRKMMMSVVEEMTTDWMAMEDGERDSMFMTMMSDTEASMKMMMPKMMEMKDGIKAGMKGAMMKALMKDMRKDEHEAMM